MKLRRIALAVLLGIAVLVLLGLWPRLFGDNFHAVIEGQVYRSAQPDEAELLARIDALGLASVVSLRPDRPAKDWYQGELRAVAARDVEFHSVELRPSKMPSVALLEELVEVLDGAPRPLLLHCQAGIDRSGLAAAFALLLDGAGLDEARRQLSPRYGHYRGFTWSRHAVVLDDYARWLEERGEEHRPEGLRHWVRSDYVPEFYRVDVAVLDLPEELRAGRDVPLRVRVTNRSPRPMRFRSSGDRGVQIRVQARHRDGGARVSRRFGYEDRTLAPSESAVFATTLPALPEPGPYRLAVELVDHHVAWFSEMGQPPLELELDALPADTTARAG